MQLVTTWHCFEVWPALTHGDYLMINASQTPNPIDNQEFAAWCHNGISLPDQPQRANHQQGIQQIKKTAEQI
jgi:hypothetical protein